MKRHYFFTLYKNKEDVRRARIVLGTILGLLAAFLVIIGIALYSGDSTLIIIMIIGGIVLAVPTVLLLRGSLRLSSLLLFVIVVASMTISANHGQGVHDIAILTFPVLIFFGSLVMQRRDFFWSSFLVLGAMAYLGFGETFGWFAPKPYTVPVGVDFSIAIIILVFAIIIADSLTESIRKNMEVARKEIALREKIQEQLRYMNFHDELTGIYNRSFFEESLMLMERRREFPVSIIFADMDNLKMINDKQGHAVGDQLLQQTTSILSNAFREGDILARIGGDEFAVLLPRTDSKSAKRILSRLQKSISEHNAKNPSLSIHISFGASTAEKSGLKEALALADQRMYTDKAIRKSVNN